MYALERLVYQGEETKPKYKWTPLARSSNKRLLETVKKQMHRPDDWRVSPVGLSIRWPGAEKGCA